MGKAQGGNYETKRPLPTTIRNMGSHNDMDIQLDE